MQKGLFGFKYLFILFFSALILNSCGVQKSSNAALYDPKEVAYLSSKLGIEISNINKNDDKNIPLYAEASLWLGAPYRYGGNNKRGVDCSGLTYQIFNKVYRLRLPRSTDELVRLKKRTVSKGKLQAGDLIFFATGKNKKKINHVGIYLKNNYFIHASTSRGVIVSRLDEDYYKQAWKQASRII